VALRYYCCSNCGYWQRRFAEPTVCPVCEDVRHVLPEDGFEFFSPEEVDGAFACSWEELDGGIWRYTVEPKLGIGPSGYLIETSQGNVAFEGAGWYSDAALDHMESLGGVDHAAASHPHAYGALWRVKERFEARLAVGVEDLRWTGAFARGPELPLGERLELLPGVELLKTGGHFDGHSVLYLSGRGVLFCGDALKFELDDALSRGSTAHAISCHKGFVRRIPLTHGEVGRYREVFEPLEFHTTITTFEAVTNAGRDEALELFDALLAEERPTTDPRPL
jgi:hypothetical protein